MPLYYRNHLQTSLYKTINLKVIKDAPIKYSTIQK